MLFLFLLTVISWTGCLLMFRQTEGRIFAFIWATILVGGAFFLAGNFRHGFDPYILAVSMMGSVVMGTLGYLFIRTK